MKNLCTLLIALFLVVNVQAQDEGGADTQTVSTTTNTNKVDTSDLASKLMARINACSSTKCFVTLYNTLAKVTSGFNKREAGINLMKVIFEQIDKKQDGVLFDIYMHPDNNYQKYFIEVAKKLPESLRNELAQKARDYQNRNN